MEELDWDGMWLEMERKRTTQSNPFIDLSKKNIRAHDMRDYFGIKFVSTSLKLNIITEP